MIKNIKKLIALALVVVTAILLLPQDTKAATTCIVRAPFNGKVVINGRTLTDADMCDYGYMDGRIQRIAAEKYSLVYKYKDYKVTVGNLNEIAVYDQNNVALTYTVRNNIVLDYTSSSNKEFNAAVESRIAGAARAYHNRVGGYDSTAFGSYFLNGSDAYVRGVASDAGRKWGQYMKAPTITAITVSELFMYSPNVFSAKVTINASGSGQEVYNIYFLFKNVNGTFYVTDFTYQD